MSNFSDENLATTQGTAELRWKAILSALDATFGCYQLDCPQTDCLLKLYAPIRAGLQPIASNRAPRRRGPRATPTKTYTLCWSCMCNAGRGAHVFLNVVALLTKIKMNRAVFNTLIHRILFWNYNSGRCFSMRGLVFSIVSGWDSVGLSFEAVFCFSCTRFVLSRLLLLHQLVSLVFWKLSLL